MCLAGMDKCPSKQEAQCFRHFCSMQYGLWQAHRRNRLMHGGYFTPIDFMEAYRFSRQTLGAVLYEQQIKDAHFSQYLLIHIPTSRPAHAAVAGCLPYIN